MSTHSLALWGEVYVNPPSHNLSAGRRREFSFCSSALTQSGPAGSLTVRCWGPCSACRFVSGCEEWESGRECVFGVGASEPGRELRGSEGWAPWGERWPEKDPCWGPPRPNSPSDPGSGAWSKCGAGSARHRPSRCRICRWATGTWKSSENHKHESRPIKFTSKCC